jgi:FkbM family methyltransferase
MGHSNIAVFSVVACLLGMAVSTTVQCEFGSRYTTGERIKTFPIPGKQILAPTIYQVDLVTDGVDQTVSDEIRSKGAWEPRNLRAAARFVKPGSRLLNLGSHIGTEVMVLGAIAGPTGRVYIFEAFSHTYSIMVKNVFLNKLSKTTLTYNVGCSNKKAQGYITVPDFNTGGSVIYYTDDFPPELPKTAIVRVDLVDSVLPSGTQLDFALIDVERLEVECLEGMKKTIEQSPDLVLMVEWMNKSVNSHDITQRIQDLLEWFATTLKYRFYIMASEGPSNCDPEHFQELTKEEVAAIRAQSDIWFVPAHIDPNLTF